MDLKSVIDTRRRDEPDLFLFITVFLMVGMGLAMSYSASANYALNTFGDPFYFLKRQFVWCVVGFAALLLFQQIDYRLYIRHTKVMLIVCFVLLIAVFIPGIGKTVKGSVRWISLGIVSLQPSEVAKLVVVIYLSKVFSSEDDGVANHVIQLLIPMLIVGVIFMLIMMQPDFGTAIDILAVSVMILFVSGFPIMYILMLFVLSIPMFYLLIYNVGYRRDRLLSYIDPWKDRFGIGYHIIQSFIAFKKGGLLGTGLGYGTQKLKRLPEPHTDFIFAVIAEEAGMLGTVFVIIIFGVFFWRGMNVSINAPDEFGRLLSVGITLLIVVQAFINIGVVSGSLPTTGIPLPFLSYGGSSLVANMIAVGILMNISKYREVVPEELKLAEGVWK
ncbi:MAG TPA: putative lipid II flippase FtsW [Spirochaetota bacterium]|nr:putative lipid II flippase FtsW [Spirochaetota bacterium]HPJ38162.1 putative lipid II flippase FtsW [Spirochaetota bacterium]HPQ52678.1 putative lipid II flippase FtsW [Spirochaetota bacterium]